MIIRSLIFYTISTGALTRFSVCTLPRVLAYMISSVWIMTIIILVSSYSIGDRMLVGF